jgi:inner membrane protein
MRRLRSYRQRLTPAAVLVAAAVFLAADLADDAVNDHSTVLAALFDETAHFLTTLLILWAIGGVVYRRLLVPALLASVLIDLDHLPAHLGWRFLTQGTPRPYTHSLLSVLVVLVAAALWRRRRVLLVAVAVGLAIHFWRDMAEPGTGVAMLWPLSDAGWSFPPGAYLALMAVAVAIGLWRAIRWPGPLRGRPGKPRRGEGVPPGAGGAVVVPAPGPHSD